MATTLNILIVEDSQDDTDLMVAELRRAGLDPMWKRVETETDFLAEIKNRPDIILSDYSMPGFTGLRAVGLLQASGLNIPFILISGTVGEDVAVEAMRHGATDYLLKDRLARLGPAVKRALLEKHLRDEQHHAAEEKRQIEEQLRHSLHTQAAVLNALSAHIALLDPEGVIVAVNDAWRHFAMANQLQGPEFGLGRNYLETCERAAGTIGAEALAIATGIRRVLGGEAPQFSTEYDCHSPTRQRWFQMVVTPLRENQRVGAVVMHVNITERKQAEAALRASEADLAEGQRVAKIGSWQYDIASNEVNWSDELYRIFGIEKTPFSGTYEAFLSCVHPDDRPSVQQVNADATAKGGSFQVEYRIQTPVGDLKTIREIGYATKDDGGKVVRLFGTAQDITAQKRAEATLRENEEKFRQLAENIPEVFWIGSSDLNTIHYVSPAYELIWGRSPESLYANAHEWFEAIIPEERQRVLAAFKALGGNEPQVNIEYRIARPDGAVRWIHDRRFKILVAAGNAVRLTGIASDITERKRDEEVLAAANQRLKAMFEGARDAIFLADPETGIIVDANEEAGRLLKLPKTAIIGLHQTQLHPPEKAEEYQRLFKEHTRRHGDLFVEADVMNSGGDAIQVEISASHINLPNGRRLFQGIFRDVSERKRTEEQLRKLSRAVEQSPASIVITNLRGEIEYVNPQFTKTCGYSTDEVFGKNSRILKSSGLSPTTYREMWDTINGGREWRGEFHSKKKNGELFWESACVSPVRDTQGCITHFLVIKEDITEKKSLEQQFHRAQRMESLGVLASGVAHDLNNILAPILMSTEYLRAVAKSPDDQEILNLLHDGARRGADIVRQLLIFGRGLEGERSELQVRTLLKETAKIIKETFPKTIALETFFSPDLWTISGNPTQIHQVLLNLCVNARDAMPHGGRLTLSAENRVIDSGAAAQIPGVRPGRNVVLSVTDTGSGIAPEILDKIFDPFFTTKEPGKGTGLGLSTVLGIVKSHGGSVQVQSLQGNGTQFDIYLPALECAGSPEVCAIVQSPPKANRQFVLLVDDEKAVRVAGRRMLEAGGYRVLTASNGAEGIIKYSKRRQDIRAVVTDLSMPIMDGVAFTRALRQISPEVRIVGISGLPAQPHDGAIFGLPVDAFLMKPFTAAQLMETLHKVLNFNEKISTTTNI